MSGAIGSDEALTRLVLDGVKRSNDPEITRIMLELGATAVQLSAKLSSLRAYVEQLVTDIATVEAEDDLVSPSQLTAAITKFLATQEDK